MPATQADFFRRLRQATVELTDGSVDDRFRSRLSKVARQLDAAGTLIERPGGPLPEEALDHLESVGRHLGEAVGLVHDRKLVDDAKGYHYEAIALLRTYCEAFAPPLAADASQFERIRAYRNMLDYPDSHWPADDDDTFGFGPSQATLWLMAARRFVMNVVPLLDADYARRHPTLPPPAL